MRAPMPPARTAPAAHQLSSAGARGAARTAASLSPMRWSAGRGECRARVSPQGTEARIVAIGQGDITNASASLGLAGWRTGMQLPTRASPPSPGLRGACGGRAPRAAPPPARRLGERRRAGAAASAPSPPASRSRRTLWWCRRPASANDPVARGGCCSAWTAPRAHAPPATGARVLPGMDNRSVLAYDIVADGDKPVVATSPARKAGRWWAADGLGRGRYHRRGGALSLARRLDAAMQPSPRCQRASNAAPASRLAWVAATRKPGGRR